MSDNVTTKDLQLAELGILKSIDKFCSINDIRYSLAYGTMLGAIRHKGFIPWDDDVDILMPRGDYERFISEYTDDKYFVKAFEKDNNWPFPFAKCFDMDIELDEHIHGCAPYGAYVDIFPMDGLPDNKIKIDRIYQKVANRWFIIARSFTESRISEKKNPFRKIARYMIITTCWGLRKTLIKKMINASHKYSYDDSDYVGTQCIGTYGVKHAVDKKELGFLINVEFEGCQFQCFEGYDYFLTHVYGDYMKLPSEEERVVHLHDLKWRRRIN